MGEVTYAQKQNCLSNLDDILRRGRDAPDIFIYAFFDGDPGFEGGGRSQRNLFPEGFVVVCNTFALYRDEADVIDAASAADVVDLATCTLIS